MGACTSSRDDGDKQKQRTSFGGSSNTSNTSNDSNNTPTMNRQATAESRNKFLESVEKKNKSNTTSKTPRQNSSSQQDRQLDAADFN